MSNDLEIAKLRIKELEQIIIDQAVTICEQAKVFAKEIERLKK